MPSPYALTVNGNVMFDPMPGAQTDFLLAQEINVFFYGNRGGGKSYCARMWCHGEALAHPNMNYIIIRKGFPELNANHLVYLRDELEAFGGTYNAADHLCRYPNGSLGFYRQCASESDVKKVVGVEAAIIVFDESPELEWEWLRLIAASARVRKSTGLKAKVRYLGNPIGPSIDDLWSYFIDKDVDPLADNLYNPADWRAIEIRMQANEHLPVDEYLKQFQGLPEHIKRAWVDGIRVVNGAYFVIDPKRHHTATRPPLHGHVDPVTGYIHPPPRIYRAIDWGWHDQAVCLWIALYSNGRAIVFRELVRTHTPAKEFASLIKSMSSDLQVRETFCDPSMFPPDDHDVELEGNIMENNGISLTKSRNDRIAAGFSISEWLNTPLSDGLPALQFWQPGCPVLCKTIPSMRMDPKKPERIADSSKDHATITLGYYCMGIKMAPKGHQPGPDPSRISNILKNIKYPTTSRLGKESVRRRR